MEERGEVNCDRRGGELKVRKSEERGTEEANWRRGVLSGRGAEAEGPVGKDRGTDGKGAKEELEVKGPELEGSWNGVERFETLHG